MNYGKGITTQTQKHTSNIHRFMPEHQPHFGERCFGNVQVEDVYKDIGWFRDRLRSIVRLALDTVPSKCQCKTTKSGGCQYRTMYMCVSPCGSQKMYVCGVHIKQLDTNQMCIIYKCFSRGGGYMHFELIQQIHSPDTYLEYSSLVNDKYYKMKRDYERTLDNLDYRATQLGDQDGSYPRELERLLPIIEKSRSLIGFDLYGIYQNNYKEIVRLRTRYLSILNNYDLLQGAIDEIPEVNFYKEKNVLSLHFKKMDTCSICFENVVNEDGGQLKGCGHTFHNNCLTKWLSFGTGDRTCPCCRKNLGRFLFAL